MLQTRTGMCAVVPALSVLTALRHRNTLEDKPFSSGSVNAASESRIFHVNPVIVLDSLGCNMIFRVVLTTPT